MIKAILFDIDGVLIDVRRGDIAMYKDLLLAAGYDEPDVETVRAVEHLPLWEGIKRLIKTDNVEEVNRVRDILLEPDVLHTDLVQSPYTLVPVLEELAISYRLGIVTSRYRAGLKPLFDQYPIASLFDVIIAYEDTAVHKPSPEPLLRAIEQLSLEPWEVVYVGDMEDDVMAAERAGCLSVHVSNNPSLHATQSAANFDAIVGAIKKSAH